MKRICLGFAAIVALGAAAAFSGVRDRLPGFQFAAEERNPVSHLRWSLAQDDFQFAIVSDRTGYHRANVFAQAIEKLNLLQPEFVITVGDLIEGTKKEEELVARWKEIDGFLGRLTMPFFYLGGNHDVGFKESAQFWTDKLGRLYYQFRYKNVLFLMLNADDPPGSPNGIGSFGQEQVAYAKKILEQNQNVRWTLVFVHRPLWNGDTKKNGWGDVEAALGVRPYTVFCGHLHQYQKYVRNGRNYYQLATTGGASRMRGVEYGEFDEIVWVTMKKDGPLLANLVLESIQTDDLKKPVTNESETPIPAKPVAKARGQAFFEGVPIPGAVVTLQPIKGGPPAVGIVAADGTFTLTTYAANDGAVAGEYKATVQWRLQDAKSKLGPNQLPAKYAAAGTSDLRVTIESGRVNELMLELRK
ncbi:MAG: metallophosphoesterase [Planctomycetes bacterium]|nr:metallophosphoesterase [Planctomycetota bacterium]